MMFFCQSGKVAKSHVHYYSDDLGTGTAIASVMDKSTDIFMAITRFPQVDDAPFALSFIFF